MKTPNTTTPLHQELRKFVVKVIAIRKRLLKDGISRRNKLLMWHHVNTLEKLITANRYDNNNKMSSFFIRHSDEIEMILPGTGSRAHAKIRQRFVELRERALIYCTNIAARSTQRVACLS